MESTVPLWVASLLVLASIAMPAIVTGVAAFVRRRRVNKIPSTHERKRMYIEAERSRSDHTWLQ